MNPSPETPVSPEIQKALTLPPRKLTATEMNRREFMRLAGLGLLASYTLLPVDSVFATTPGADPSTVFPQSVASGDPTPSGFVLWTRIDPSAYSAGLALMVQVATDSAFSQIVTSARVLGANIKPSLDHTVRVDFNGLLQPNTIYYYRFTYNGVTSKTGRGKTLPPANFALDSLKLAVVNCNDYTNGFYPAYSYIAADDTLDFVVHVGDFIYETTGQTSFQTGSYPGRSIPLDSGLDVALGLSDYRTLYQTYRSDPFLQAAMENFTWIIIWDDHEMANDCYHDYMGNANGQSAGAPDHPFTTDTADFVTPALPTEADLLRQLKYDSMQAWFEYVPSRTSLNLSSPDIFGRLQIYRKFSFGTLVDLFMTDERTYRSSHPLGEVQYGERYIAPFELSNPDSATNNSTRTMLGQTQRSWFINGVAASTALWKAWGNEVLLSPLTVALPTDTPPSTAYATLAAEINQLLGTNIIPGVPSTFDNDSWDGYQYERIVIAQSLAGAYAATGRALNTLNLVVLSGDLHSYVASYFKLDYSNPSNAASNVVGVEYMTPAITSADFAEQFAPFAAIGFNASALEQIAMNPQVNPHMVYFNSSNFGYATVEFDRSNCTYTMYNVDKTVNSATASRTILKQFQTPVNSSQINTII